MLPRSIFFAATFALIAACSSDGSAPDSSDAAGWDTVHCANSESGTNPQGGCTRGYSGCSDGHSYGIDCAAAFCTCRIDSTATGRALTTGCGADGLAGLAANCDWHNH